MLETLTPLPPDPILGLITAYRDDPNPDKIDLSVGIYKDDDGTTPVLEAVADAERHLVAEQTTKSYVAPPGDPDFLAGLCDVLFGAGHPAVAAGRVRAVQSPGGCGALRLGGELVQRIRPGATLWVPDPTWANHIPLLGDAGLRIEQYPYYDRAAHAIDFDAMAAALSALQPGDVALFHGCCHNPCGADLVAEQWRAVADLVTERGITPIVDLAYQGLGEGLEADAYGARLLAERAEELLVAYSCSKNFGLYRERAGMIAVVAATPEAAFAAQTHLNSIARGIYSMPPSHGAAIVGRILADEALTAAWQAELGGMRDRLNGMRRLLADTLAAKGAPEFGFIARERGMFSFLGFTPQQVRTLIETHSVYLVDSSRINVAGVSKSNVEHLAEAIITVRDHA